MICNAQVTNQIRKAQLEYNLCNRCTHFLYVCKSETQFTVQMANTTCISFRLTFHRRNLVRLQNVFFLTVIITVGEGYRDTWKIHTEQLMSTKQRSWRSFRNCTAQKLILSCQKLGEALTLFLLPQWDLLELSFCGFYVCSICIENTNQ